MMRRMIVDQTLSKRWSEDLGASLQRRTTLGYAHNHQLKGEKKSKALERKRASEMLV